MSIFDFARRARQDVMNKNVPTEPAPATPPPAAAATDNMPTTKPDAPATPADLFEGLTIDTDGYARPGFRASGFGNAPPGWDQTKWLNEAHQTPKYVWGRIGAQFGSRRDGSKDSGDIFFDTPEQFSAATDALMKAYPGAKQVSKEKYMIPGVGLIDLSRDFDEKYQRDPSGKLLGANGISWGTEGPAGGGKDLASLLGPAIGASLGGSSALTGGGPSKIKEILDQIAATGADPLAGATSEADPLAQQQAIREAARRDALTRGFERGA